MTPQPKGKIKLGRKGEKIARKYLKKHGYRHLASNFATKQGEIDLIMQQDRTIVFVEVKTRRQEDFASGEDVVNLRKQRHIETAARQFIRRYSLYAYACRFDVIAVVLPEKGTPTIRHQRNAFSASR